MSTLARYVGEHREESWFRWYREGRQVGLNRSAVGWHPRSSPQAEVYIEVKQTDCDELGYRDSLALLGELVGLGMKVTRLDVFVDDWARVVRPAEMVAAFDAGHTVTRIEKRSLRDDGLDAQVATFGARSGEWYLRVYDKPAPEADPFGVGQTNARGTLQGSRVVAPADGRLRVRHELEAKGHTAREVAAALLAGQEPSDTLWAYVSGVLDFRERERGTAHGERAPRLGWWAALVEGAERTRVVARERVDHLAKRAIWLRRQVARSLASVHAVYGEGWLSRLLEDGADRMTMRDYAVMRAAAP